MNASPCLGAARLVITIVALSTVAPSSWAQQWVQQSPIPHGNLIHDVGAPTAEAAFIAGEDSEWDDPRGPLFRTLDAGDTWADVPLPNQFELNDIFFLDSQHGWAVGDVNWRTADGGQTWQRMPFLGSAYFVEFYTPDFGYTSGNFGRMTTRNGGESWQFSPGRSNAFSFRDDQVGLAAGPNGIRRTTNGGQTWTVVRSGNTAEVQFLTGDVALAIAGGRFLRSADGGLTWTDEGAAQGRTELLRVSGDVALAYETVYFPGEGRLLRTDDGGQTWDDLGNAIPGGIYEIERLDDQTVVALTVEGFVWRSADAGATWTMTYDVPAVGFDGLGMDFADDRNGYIAGGYGLVLRTTDGGITWTQVSNGYGAGADIDRFDDRRFLVASSEPLLTEDGGATWRLVNDGIREAGGYVAVQVVEDPFAVMLSDGNDVRVSKTFDGGHTWEATNPIPYPAFAVSDAGDLHFRTPQDGWVVGRDAAFFDNNIFRTTDGGQTWFIPPTFPTSSAHVWVGVDFEGQRGWVVSGVQLGGGEGARLPRTEDGGATWITEELPDSYPYNMKDVEFFDENTGYVVGSGGYAARSTDGGDTWTVLNVPPSSSPYGYTMWDLYLTSPTDVWVATTEDVVLHSDDGGQTWEELEVNSRPETFGSFTGVAATEEGSAWAIGFRGHIYALNPPAPPAVTVLAQPVSPPVVIGPDGGTFDFTVTLTNTTGQPQTVHAWTSVEGPVSVNPVLGPVTVTLPAGATVARTLTQAVPAAAPAGAYAYSTNVQLFQGSILDSSAFTIVKEASGAAGRLAAAQGSDAASGWGVSGWEVAAAVPELPDGFALSEVHPNPLHGRAQFTLAVGEAQRVTAEIFDALGRRVAVLHEGALEAGAHAFVLDGSALPAGLYVVRVTGETFSGTRRATLVR